MTKPNFRPIQQPLAVPDAALDRLNDRMGVPTMSCPDILQTLPKANARAPAPARTLEKLSVELPTYLMDAMKQEALSRKVSVRHLVMIALKGQGLAIEPEDLVPDARRTAYKGRRVVWVSAVEDIAPRWLDAIEPKLMHRPLQPDR